MNANRHLTAPILLLSTVVVATVHGADPDPKVIDAFFSAAARPGSPGCELAVVRNGEFAYKKAYGLADIEHGIPLTTASPIIIGSDAKQFTAAAVARLASDGRISLDDSIRKAVPELPSWADGVTVRHLIHHTSGLRDYPTLLSMGGHPEALSERQFLRLMTRQKALNFSPGSRFLYSNSNYAMLSILVRRVAGKSLRVYADEVLFQPLGMRNTHFHDNRTELVANRVLPYALAGTSFRIEGDTADSLVAPQAPAVVGDGNLFTTADDLLGWARYLDGPAGTQLGVAGKLSDGTTIDYAFGLVRVTSSTGVPFLAHGGNNGAYRAGIVHYPSEKLTVGVYCNHGGVEPQAISLNVAALYLPPDPPRPGQAAPVSVSPSAEPTATVSVSPGDLAGFAGRYFSPELDGAQEITHASGVLRLVSRTAEGELRPTGADRFTWSSWVFSFTRDQAGHVTGYTLDGTRASGLQFSRVVE